MTACAQSAVKKSLLKPAIDSCGIFAPSNYVLLNIYGKSIYTLRVFHLYENND